MNKSDAEFIFHVFIYFWAHVVALNSRQHCRLLIALAGELTVTAGVSRTDFWFKTSFLMLPSAVAAYWFFPFFITVTSHWRQRGDVATNAAVINWQLRDWCPYHSLPRWNKLPALQEKKSLRGDRRSAPLFVCLYPEMGTPAPGGRDEREEYIPWKFTAQLQKWMEEAWNAKLIFS